MISLRIALTAVLVLCASAPAQSVTSIARVSSVTGAAMLSTSGSAAFALTTGYTLNPGDKVDTRAGGRVVIELSDTSIVIVQPGTLLFIKDFRAAASVRELLEILTGAIRVRIHHITGKPNPYRMNSPTASIAVRGTEFNVIVGEDSNTKVEVFEGAVEVGSLTDPNNMALIEAGGGVLVRPGHPLQFFGAGLAKFGPTPSRGIAVAADRQKASTTPPRPPPPEFAVLRPSERGHGAGAQHREIGRASSFAPAEPLQVRTLAPQSAGAYERYLATLTSVDYLPFLTRFTAFSDLHIDSFENPAYAASFQAPEGRLSFTPTRTAASGGASEYALMPQISYFDSIGKRLVFGGGVSTAHLDSAGSTATSFSSMTALTAVRFGRTSAGLSADRLRGSGQSTLGQMRVTLGLRRELGRGRQAGLFYRYGALDASPVTYFDSLGATADGVRQSGRTSEAGLRVRGPLTRNLRYGASLSIGLLSMNAGRWNGQQSRSQRGSATAGLGYAPDRRTVLTFDASGGWSSRMPGSSVAGSMPLISTLDSRFTSVHISAQRDLMRRLWITGSWMNVWRFDAMLLNVPAVRSGTALSSFDSFNTIWSNPAPGGRFAEIGAGYRLSPSLSVQYLFGGGAANLRSTHTVAVRYSFRLREQVGQDRR